MSRVSVIIPVYNGEKELARCVTSILNQTFREIEVFIIDDGSVDRTYEVAQELLKSDERIHYYKKENGGVSSARNYGLDKVKSDFVMFVDHDDFLDNDYIEHLYHFSLENDLDLVRSGYQIVDQKQVIQERIGYSSNNVILKKYDFQIFLDTTFFGYAGGLLLQRKIIGETRFNESLHFAEDLSFICECYQKSGKMGYCNHYGYNYFVHGNSMTKKSDLNVRIRECQDNISVFSNFLNYGVSEVVVANTIYKRLNLKFKYLLKTTKVHYFKFRKIIAQLYSLNDFISLKDKGDFSSIQETNKNKLLIFFLMHHHFFLYFCFVKLYQLFRK